MYMITNAEQLSNIIHELFYSSLGWFCFPYQLRFLHDQQTLFVLSHLQIRNVETNQCVDNMGRKENEKVGFFNCHGMGGNQVRTQWPGQET